MIFEGIYRRFAALKSGRGPIDARFTLAESLAVAQVEPPNLEMTRAGRRILLGNGAAITGIAPVQALPTTVAQWTIFNNDPSASYWIEELGMYLTSGTPGVGAMLLAALFQTPSGAANANDAGISISNASIAASRVSKAVVKSAITATKPAAPTWYPIASNASPNVTAFASSTFLENRNIQGAIVIPPGYGLGLNVVAPAGTTPLFAPFGRWVEFESDLE